MPDDYGRQIGQAFAAVYQLHQDVSRLLMDCDGAVGKGRRSVFGSVIAKDQSRAVYKPDGWMPYAVLRYYAGGDLPPAVAEGLMVHFWDELPKPQEPVLALGRLEYRLGSSGVVDKSMKIWDLWYACFKWVDTVPIGEVVRVQPAEHERVVAVTVMAVPLYSITAVDEVGRLMGRVRPTS